MTLPMLASSVAGDKPPGARESKRRAAALMIHLALPPGSAGMGARPSCRAGTPRAPADERRHAESEFPFP
jgi:hypothetical protein